MSRSSRKGPFVDLKLLAKVETMRGEDPGAWTAFQLMTWGGLRNKECLHARESWLEEIPGAGAWRLQLKPAADFRPKGNSRHVVLPVRLRRDEVREALARMRAERDRMMMI